MPKVSAQQQETQKPSGVPQKSTTMMASPQSEKITQLEAMMDSGLHSEKQQNLANKINTPSEKTSQKKIIGMVHNSPNQTVQQVPATIQPPSNSPRQRKTIPLGVHGQAKIPDSVVLTPDKPVYGGSQTILGEKIATSMEVLVTPNHPQGSAPKELGTLFQKLPTKGDYDRDINTGKTRSGERLYIKGHLLNDNLGGPGIAQNLFPITHKANVDHDRLVEEPVKDRVNKEGGVVRYKVTATATSTGTTDMKYDNGNYMSYVNGTFLCNVTEYPSADASEAVYTSSTITSKWNEIPDNGVKLVMNEHFAKANAFDSSKVNIMPRAKIKQEWDNASFLIAGHLANATGITAEKWLPTLKIGIGPKGAKLLSMGVDYRSLSKTDKRTLTLARNILKKYITENYAHYLSVEADYDDDTVSDQDKSADININQIKHETDNINLSLKELYSMPDVYNLADIYLRKNCANAIDSAFKEFDKVDPATYPSRIMDMTNKVKLAVLGYCCEALNIEDKSWSLQIITELVNILLRQIAAKTSHGLESRERFSLFCKLAHAINDGNGYSLPITYLTNSATLWIDSSIKITAPKFTIMEFDKNGPDKFMESRGLTETSLFYQAYLLEGEHHGKSATVNKEDVAHRLL